MKKLLLILLVLLAIHVHGQNDLVFLHGVKDPVQCTVIEVTRFTVTYMRQSDRKFTVASATDIDKIQLERSTDTSALTTEDLFKALADKDSDLFTWYGLDFSFVDICDLKNREKYSNTSFSRMNNFILLPEEKNFGIKGPNKKRFLLGYGNPELSHVRQVNKQIPVDKVFRCDSNQVLPLNEIRKAVQGYRSAEAKKGIGAVVFYRSIDKYYESCSVYITFFDISTGNVLFIINQKIKGAGMKQEWHWTSRLLPIMNKLRNSYGSYFSDMMKIYGIE